MARDPLTATWSGRDAQRARAVVKQWLTERGPMPCGQRCGQTVSLEDEWVVGHIKDRVTHPELTWDMTNWWPEHRGCSDSSGQSAVIAKAKADALAEAGLLPAPTTGRTPPPRPVSLPEDHDGPDQLALPGVVVTSPFAGTALKVRPELLWDRESLSQYPWLADLVLNVPDDANPPLWMSPPPTDAVGSYGDGAIWWIESTQGMTLRWWQRLAIVRQLEHRADGSLCCETYIESAPRRAGKSVRMRGVALWRLEDPLELFDETQLVMHTGNDLATCREIQRGAWVWAERHWGAKSVTRANGKESIETPDGDRWLTRSQDAVYGYDVCLAMVDESWDVKPETVADGLEPAMLERIMPQLSLTSTAHPRTTSLMPTYLTGALTSDDPTVTIVVWAVDPARLAGLTAAKRAELLADPDLWKSASPHWTPQRATYIASKWERARAAKPTPDNPDPIRTFEKQYLNVWTLDVDTSLPGEPLATATEWDNLRTLEPEMVPVAAAIESWFGAGVSLAVAWKLGQRVVVAVTDHQTIADAVAALRAHAYRGVVVVGSSHLEDPALTGVRTKKGEGSAGAAVREMTGMLRERIVRHDGTTHLAEQVIAARTLPTAEGVRMASNGRADAIKAAVWAIAAARVSRRRKTGLVTATTSPTK